MTKILGPDGRPYAAAPPPRTGPAVRARYDAAQTTSENAAHWANADALSARAANDPATRRKLRERARYETSNNSYARGMTKRVADAVIGTGPRLRLKTGSRDTDRRVQKDFAAWAGAVGLAAKLRTMRASRMTDGESFGLLVTNPKLPTPVQLDVRLIECDQVATPDLFWPSRSAVDGVVYDEWGNPEAYHVLRQHPGDTYWLAAPWQYDAVPAGLVVHWFVAERPGQCRGVPEITAALPLFAQLRRYTLATLSAAEIAALFAALLKTTAPPDLDDAGGGVQPFSVNPFDTTPIERGMMTALPDGYDFTQLRAEQPTTTYPQFKRELVNEAASGCSIPSNIALGDSSQYNYSSSQLDKQWFLRAIDIDRAFAAEAVLDRVLSAWLAEYRLVTRMGAGEAAAVLSATREWHWDGFTHADPTKEADAQKTRLENGTTTLEDEWAAEGCDWQEKADQQAAERKYFAGLGIPYPGDRPAAPPPQPPRTPPPNEQTPTGGGNADDPTAD